VTATANVTFPPVQKEIERPIDDHDEVDMTAEVRNGAGFSAIA
jgi:hypothetical protein